MDKTISAVEIAINNTELCENKSIIISGTYKWKLFGNDTFSGSIKIDDYDITENNFLFSQLRIYDGVARIEYGTWDNNQLFGIMSCSPFLNSIVIQIYESTENGGSWSTEDGHCIVAPAMDRNDALKIIGKFHNSELPPNEYWV